MSNASTVETARSMERLINIVKRIKFETRKQPRRQYTNTASFEAAVSDEMRLAISLQSQTIKPQYSPGAPTPPRFFYAASPWPSGQIGHAQSRPVRLRCSPHLERLSACRAFYR